MKSVRLHRVFCVSMAALLLSAAGCKQTDPQSSIEQRQEQQRQAEATQEVAEPVPTEPTKPELPPLFDDIERRTFQFFWDTTNERNGLTPDRFPSRPFSSIASVGFALTAYPIGIENG